MPLVHRVTVTPSKPMESLEHYVRARGGRGIDKARGMAPEAIVERVRASGLRGRGGAGFPTGVKWATVREHSSPDLPTTVVVNAAEGEPGTFKDRHLLRTNVYAVLEGALIAARAVGADLVVIALKARFVEERERVAAAITEIEAAGWLDGTSISIVAGPSSYLFGEETALLEVLDGRQPFPRIAPPFRRGADEVLVSVTDRAASHSGSAPPVQRDVSDSGLSGRIEMADGEDPAPPALVGNVETFANVPRIMWRGPSWFRGLGTTESPGSLVCTVTGAVRTAGVYEVSMGTTMRELIDHAGGARRGSTIVGVLPGVSSAFLPADRLDTPLTYEHMAAAGSGLGSGSFHVIDDTVDLLAVAAGVSRFLFVESCGQCEPCKQDGRTISTTLDLLLANDANSSQVDVMRRRLVTVSNGARCALGRQHETVVSSLVAAAEASVDAHLRRAAEPTDRVPVAALVDIENGAAVLDPDEARKQPDWTYDDEDSGKSPVDRFTDHRR